MTAAGILTLAAALCANAASAAPEPPSAATTSPSLSPSALCGVEVPWGRGGFFGRRLDLANPAQCLEFCGADRTLGECVSFSFSSSGTYWIHNAPAADVISSPSAGIWIWDKECWDCGELGPIGDVPTRTTSAATATATCLSPTARCEVEARWKGDEAVGSWGRYVGGEVEDGPYACWRRFALMQGGRIGAGLLVGNLRRGFVCSMIIVRMSRMTRSLGAVSGFGMSIVGGVVLMGICDVGRALPPLVKSSRSTQQPRTSNAAIIPTASIIRHTCHPCLEKVLPSTSDRTRGWRIVWLSSHH
ncbi:hypothetical protein CSOJ01_14845 [Colletotrichum sojae]|uniref:Apple domain-containing protein n=1 Tax=Colletotrichum sojae TaxID=2175907 RepID=A0A8H6MJG3_9PEZI|nr:hypothetical protein CSOJ01_14845 [Colletotrichum sojae]